MAVSSSSLTTVSGLLKQFYDKPEVIKNVMISAGPLLKKLLEDGDQEFTGINYPSPIIIGSGGGVGSQIATVSANSSPAQTVNFLITRCSAWGYGQVGQQVLEASANAPEGAFLTDAILEVDAKRMRYMQYLAHLMYGWGDGVLFQESHTDSVAHTYILLDDPLLAAKVQTGDVLQYSATAGGAPGDAGALGYVLGVSLFGATAGRITMSNAPGGAATALSTIWPSIANDAFFVMAGDTATAVSDNGTGPAVLQGIMAWTGTGALWGVTAATRAANPAFLSVNIIDCTAAGLGLATVRQSIALGVAQAATVSGHPKDAYCSPSLWFRLSEELQAQGMYTGSKGQGPSGEGSFGFSSLVMPTPTGDVTVSMDPQAMSYLPYASYGAGYSGANIVYLLETETMDFLSLGEMGKLDNISADDNTNYFLRTGTGSYSYQMSGFGNPTFHAPGHCFVLLCPQ
jgi:hypothetical protein